MEILFNPRENGACPFCVKLASCGIRQKLGEAMAGFKDPNAQCIELVIYTCPQFEERF